MLQLMKKFFRKRRRAPAIQVDRYTSDRYRAGMAEIIERHGRRNAELHRAGIFDAKRARRQFDQDVEALEKEIGLFD